ncbi:MAG: InlB B-repeat-containing protein, partial [Candidatus Ancillula sp.]|nr:InlB B-repeat-containing protein [Candidatus Ancillula sp.]
MKLVKRLCKMFNTSFIVLSLVFTFSVVSLESNNFLAYANSGHIADNNKSDSIKESGWSSDNTSYIIDNKDILWGWINSSDSDTYIPIGQSNDCYFNAGSRNTCTALTTFSDGFAEPHELARDILEGWSSSGTSYAIGRNGDLWAWSNSGDTVGNGYIPAGDEANSGCDFVNVVNSCSKMETASVTKSGQTISSSIGIPRRIATGVTGGWSSANTTYVVADGTLYAWSNSNSDDSFIPNSASGSDCDINQGSCTTMKSGITSTPRKIATNVMKGFSTRYISYLITPTGDMYSWSNTNNDSKSGYVIGGGGADCDFVATQDCNNSEDINGSHSGVPRKIATSILKGFKTLDATYVEDYNSNLYTWLNTDKFSAPQIIASDIDQIWSTEDTTYSVDKSGNLYTSSQGSTNLKTTQIKNNVYFGFASFQTAYTFDNGNNLYAFSGTGQDAGYIPATASGNQIVDCNFVDLSNTCLIMTNKLNQTTAILIAKNNPGQDSRTREFNAVDNPYAWIDSDHNLYMWSPGAVNVNPALTSQKITGSLSFIPVGLTSNSECDFTRTPNTCVGMEIGGTETTGLTRKVATNIKQIGINYALTMSGDLFMWGSVAPQGSTVGSSCDFVLNQDCASLEGVQVSTSSQIRKVASHISYINVRGDGWNTSAFPLYSNRVSSGTVVYAIDDSDTAYGFGVVPPEAANSEGTGGSRNCNLTGVVALGAVQCGNQNGGLNSKVLALIPPHIVGENIASTAGAVGLSAQGDELGGFDNYFLDNSGRLFTYGVSGITAAGISMSSTKQGVNNNSQIIYPYGTACDFTAIPNTCKYWIQSTDSYQVELWQVASNIIQVKALQGGTFAAMDKDNNLYGWAQDASGFLFDGQYNYVPQGSTTGSECDLTQGNCSKDTKETYSFDTTNGTWAGTGFPKKICSNVLSVQAGLSSVLVIDNNHNLYAWQSGEISPYSIPQGGNATDQVDSKSDCDFTLSTCISMEKSSSSIGVASDKPTDGVPRKLASGIVRAGGIKSGMLSGRSSGYMWALDESNNLWQWGNSALLTTSYSASDTSVGCDIFSLVKACQGWIMTGSKLGGIPRIIAQNVKDLGTVISTSWLIDSNDSVWEFGGTAPQGSTLTDGLPSGGSPNESCDILNRDGKTCSTMEQMENGSVSGIYDPQKITGFPRVILGYSNESWSTPRTDVLKHWSTQNTSYTVDDFNSLWAWSEGGSIPNGSVANQGCNFTALINTCVQMNTTSSSDISNGTPVLIAEDIAGGWASDGVSYALDTTGHLYTWGDGYALSGDSSASVRCEFISVVNSCQYFVEKTTPHRIAHNIIYGWSSLDTTYVLDSQNNLYGFSNGQSSSNGGSTAGYVPSGNGSANYDCDFANPAGSDCIGMVSAWNGSNIQSLGLPHQIATNIKNGWSGDFVSYAQDESNNLYTWSNSSANTVWIPGGTEIIGTTSNNCDAVMDSTSCTSMFYGNQTPRKIASSIISGWGNSGTSSVIDDSGNLYVWSSSSLNNGYIPSGVAASSSCNLTIVNNCSKMEIASGTTGMPRLVGKNISSGWGSSGTSYVIDDYGNLYAYSNDSSDSGYIPTGSSSNCDFSISVGSCTKVVKYSSSEETTFGTPRKISTNIKIGWSSLGTSYAIDSSNNLFAWSNQKSDGGYIPVGSSGANSACDFNGTGNNCSSIESTDGSSTGMPRKIANDILISSSSTPKSGWSSNNSSYFIDNSNDIWALSNSSKSYIPVLASTPSQNCNFMIKVSTCTKTESANTSAGTGYVHQITNGQAERVTGVTLNKNTSSLSLAGTDQLVAKIAPDTAVNQAVTWTSSDSSAVSVDSTGKVTALIDNVSVLITVTTDDGGFTAFCVVNVGNPPYTLRLYTITFNPDGGKGSMPKQTLICQDSGNGCDVSVNLNKNKFMKVGYTFQGWSDGETTYKDQQLFTHTLSDGNEVLNLTAQWTAIPYTVTFNSNGGSVVPSQSIISGQKVTKPKDPTKSGMLFTGWFTSLKLTKSYDFDSPVTADLVLYAGYVSKDDSPAWPECYVAQKCYISDGSNGKINGLPYGPGQDLIPGDNITDLGPEAQDDEIFADDSGNTATDDWPAPNGDGKVDQNQSGSPHFYDGCESNIPPKGSVNYAPDTGNIAAGGGCDNDIDGIPNINDSDAANYYWQPDGGGEDANGNGIKNIDDATHNDCYLNGGLCTNTSQTGPKIPGVIDSNGNVDITTPAIPSNVINNNGKGWCYNEKTQTSNAPCAVKVVDSANPSNYFTVTTDNKGNLPSNINMSQMDPDLTPGDHTIILQDTFGNTQKIVVTIPPSHIDITKNACSKTTNTTISLKKNSKGDVVATHSSDKSYFPIVTPTNVTNKKMIFSESTNAAKFLKIGSKSGVSTALTAMRTGVVKLAIVPQDTSGSANIKFKISCNFTIKLAQTSKSTYKSFKDIDKATAKVFGANVTWLLQYGVTTGLNDTT